MVKDNPLDLENIKEKQDEDDTSSYGGRAQSWILSKYLSVCYLIPGNHFGLCT